MKWLLLLHACVLEVSTWESDERAALEQMKRGEERFFLSIGADDRTKRRSASVQKDCVAPDTGYNITRLVSMDCQHLRSTILKSRRLRTHDWPAKSLAHSSLNVCGRRDV
jgi:hypothetical protein